MNTKAKYFLIVLGLLCLAYPGFAWLIGWRVEASMLKREQQVMDQYPGSIVLISRQYHRGVYGATEELTYGFGASTLRALAPLATTSNGAALRITVHNTIHHGPVPQFRTVGLATVSTQVDLPTEVSAKLRAVLGGAPAIQIRSRLGWLGGMSTEVSSPGYEGRLTDGTQISWHGFEAKSSATANLSADSLDAALGDFEVKSTKIQAQLAGLRIRADWRRAFEGLYTGPFDVKIATVKWQSLPASSPGLIQGLSIGGSGAAEGDYYESTAHFDADAVQTSGYSVTHAGYAISLEHLHGPTIAAMMKEMRESRVNAGAATQPPPVAAIDTLKKNGVELLLHEPVLNISRIGFAMPEGEMRLSATASAPGLKREDLDGPQVAAALMQHLNVVADLRIDAALATRLLANSARKDAVAAQIDALEHQGYIKRDGAALTAHVTFAGGKIVVNGLPYPPSPGR